MNRRRFLWGLGAAAGAGLGGIGYSRLVEPNWLEFTEHRLPRGRDGRRSPGPSIAQISDLHLRELGDQHDTIAAEIARRRPDVLVITGDSIDQRGSMVVLEEFLSLLPYDIPKYAILGNWEHWAGVDARQLSAVYERANCELLVNRSAAYGSGADTIRFSGVDDLIGGRPALNELLGKATVGDFHVLLAHCPAHRDQLTADHGRVDLVLSGHTHGGQVQIFGRAPLVPRGSGRYVEGWYRDADGWPALYVSRGVGTSVLPVRFGARPEVAFFGGPSPAIAGLYGSNAGL